MSCTHKYIHKETTRQIETNGRSFSNHKTWYQTDVYFCEKCLKEEIVKKEWFGLENEADRPDWTKQGKWERITNW